MRFVELFAGIAGFRRGLEQANQGVGRLQPSISEGRECQGIEDQRELYQNRKFTCVWANELDKHACQIYSKHFGDGELHEGDIRAVDVDTIPAHELLTAGFPCQAFSVAGKRQGFADTRGTLFYEICRVAQAKRPRLLLLENVKGLLSHDEGLTYQIILESLEELGYWCEWQVLNSKHYGVPQNRERVFIIGHSSEDRGREVFPLRAITENSTERSDGGKRQISKSIRKGSSMNARGTYVRGVTLANTSRYNQGVSRTPLKQDDTSFALNSAGDQGIIEKMRIRRLTPVECERLQGFPDGWTVGISNTQRYKCLGNAVTVNVIEALGYALRRSR